MSPKSLPGKPCLSRFGLWFCCAAFRRAFTKLLVMLGVAAEFELEPHQIFPALPEAERRVRRTALGGLLRGRRRRGRHTDYRRFATAAEAIHYAVEELRARRSISDWMQVGED